MGETLMSPPALCGLEWVHDPATEGWVAADTPALAAAWSWHDSRAGLEHAGVGRRPADPEAVEVTSWLATWRRPFPAREVDMVEVRRRVAEAPACIAEQAAIDASLARAEVAAAERDMDDLRDVMATLGWAMTPKARDEAGRILAREPMVRARFRSRAIALAADARAAVRKVGAKVDVDAAALALDDVKACADHDVRAAVLEGCRGLSVADDDRASLRNGAGWSPATSRSGHWLAAQASLDGRRAAVGMRLLRTHQRQLPQGLLVRLGFVPAPAPRLM